MWKGAFFLFLKSSLPSFFSFRREYIFWITSKQTLGSVWVVRDAPLGQVCSLLASISGSQTVSFTWAAPEKHVLGVASPPLRWAECVCVWWAGAGSWLQQAWAVCSLGCRTIHLCAVRPTSNLPAAAMLVWTWPPLPSWNKHLPITVAVLPGLRVRDVMSQGRSSLGAFMNSSSGPAGLHFFFCNTQTIGSARRGSFSFSVPSYKKTSGRTLDPAQYTVRGEVIPI